MNLISINIRGIGCKVKRDWIKELRLKHKATILGIQETKSSEVMDGFDRIVWGGLNFSCEVLDPVGQSGGIATLWDPGVFMHDRTVRLDGCLATGGTWVPTNKKIWLLNIYASQQLTRKEKMWLDISSLIASDLEAGFICFGDFNAVRSMDERLGSVFCHRTAARFNNFIHESGLIELNLGGKKFTYMSSDCGKHSKLDRFLVSPVVLNFWPDLKATALNRLYSDHCPILLSSGVIDFGPYPFRFFNTWLSDPKLDDLVMEIWNKHVPLQLAKKLSPLPVLTGKFKHLKSLIRAWRNEVTATQKWEVENLKQKIEKIDQLAEIGQNTSQMGLDRAEAVQRVREIEAIKILDLRQKSRSKWALEGDENSSYFHGIINKHLRSQRINGLSIGGQWISDPIKIKSDVVKFFEAKFSERADTRPRFINPGFRKLDLEQKNSLESPISLEEIKSAIWGCGANKAPGPDGFSLEFYRKYWDTIKSDLFLAIKQFEKTGVIEPGCNASFITLVPKVADPVSLNDFRPISLIGSLYKVISKILAERLKKVISTVISPEQTAFIKGRSILDGPLITTEILSWLRRCKKKGIDVQS